MAITTTKFHEGMYKRFDGCFSDADIEKMLYLCFQAYKLLYNCSECPITGETEIKQQDFHGLDKAMDLMAGPSFEDWLLEKLEEKREENVWDQNRLK